jgi:hypothetical protein
MQPDSAVGRGHDRTVARAPHRHDPVDRTRIEIRTVAEDDDRSFDVVCDGNQATAKRRAWPKLPVGTLNRPFARLELVRAEHDDDLCDRGAPAHPLEDRLEQHGLLR